MTTSVFLTPPFLLASFSLSEFPAIAAATSKFQNPEGQMEESLKRLGFWCDFRSRVGGFPIWVQRDTFDQGDTTFVAQIDFEPHASNLIRDCAPIYLAASTSEPTRLETDTFQTF